MWAFHSSSPSSPSPSPSSPHTQTDAHEMYQLGKQKCVIMVNQYNISQFLFSFCISMCISVWKYEFFFVNVCLLCLFFLKKKIGIILCWPWKEWGVNYFIYFFYFIYFIFILFFLYISMCSSLDYSLRPSTHLAEHWHSQSQTSFFFNFLFPYFLFSFFFLFKKILTTVFAIKRLEK